MSWLRLTNEKTGQVEFDSRDSALVRDPETNETEEIFFPEPVYSEALSPRWARFMREIEAHQAEREALISKMENQVIEGKKRLDENDHR